MISGIVLSGGGARGAYQAGVIRALGEVSKRQQKGNPFRLVGGISAGAINAAFLASHSDNIHQCGRQLVKMWGQLSTDQIVSINAFTLGRIGASLIKQLSTGALTRQTPLRSLLKTQPLEKLLTQYLPPGQIQKQIDRGVLDGLAITATSYENSFSRSFIQAREGWEPWRKARRESEASAIGIDHVMASSAIPILFPPRAINGVYYGDGGLRNSAPLSPLIHLGAEQLIVVGVRMQELEKEFLPMENTAPNLARVSSVLIHGMLMDGIDVDVERLHNMNRLAELFEKLPSESPGQDPVPRKVECLWISPSKNLSEIALKWVDEAPSTILYLMKGLGAEREVADLLSYLLFEAKYCQELAGLGYADTMAKKAELKEFFARASYAPATGPSRSTAPKA